LGVKKRHGVWVVDTGTFLLRRIQANITLQVLKTKETEGITKLEVREGKLGCISEWLRQKKKGEG